MKSFKDTYPTSDLIRRRFDNVLQGSFKDFLDSTHVRRQAVIGNRRYFAFATAFSLAMIPFLYYLQPYFGTLPGKIVYGVCVIWLLVILLSAREWVTNTRLLAKEVNMALVPIISNTIDKAIIYTHDTDHREETRQFLVDSELMTTANIEVDADDMFTIYDERDISIRELLVTERKRDSKGRDTVSTIFKGVFVVTTLPQSYPAKIFISTDNDRVGFAHQTFWKNLFARGQVQETNLEWNDFDNHLHVATNNPVVARELLTPIFMQDLHAWWQEHKLNMRIAIHDDKFYMLLPEATIKIGVSTNSTDLGKIIRYAWSLMQPMWRTLVLLEDIARK